MNGVEQLCAGLSQDNIENLTAFVAEANMLRANNCQKGISTDDAVKYLRAANFNATKAVDIYKNYQKHRETYNLDNLRPYREPLSSEIGSKKLEIVGTLDEEGSPLVLFTVYRHDVKHSDTKAAMLLLFYTLDQLAELEEAQENGIVLLIDARESSLSLFDPRFFHHILTVTQSGYPLYLKMVYLIGVPMWMKAQMTFINIFKQESRTKSIHFSELPNHFSEDLLPLSLGGSYTPSRAGGSNGRLARSTSERSDRKYVLQSSNIMRMPSDPADKTGGACKSSLETKQGSHQPPGAVNNLVGMFENKTKHPVSEHKSPSPPLPPSKPLIKADNHPFHHKPSPPFRPLLPTRVPPPASISQAKHNRQSPPPAAQHRLISGPQKQESYEEPNSPKRKVPLKPPSGPTQRNVATATVAIPNSTTSSGAKPSSPSRSVGDRIRRLEKKSSFGNSLSPSTEGDMIQERPSVSRLAQELSASWPDRKAAESAQKPASPNLGSRGSPLARGKKPLVQVKLLSVDKEEREELEREQERERERELEKENKRKKEREREKEQERRREREKEEREREREKEKREKEREREREREREKKRGEVPSPKLDKKLPLLPEAQKLQQSYIGSPSPTSEENSMLYENIGYPQSQARDVHPSSSGRAKPLSYEKVTVHYTSAAKPATTTAASRSRSDSGTASQSPASVRHNYENIEILTPPGFLEDSDEDDVLLGVEPPQVEEAIYENFGPDEGNHAMSPEELEKHVNSKGKKGLAVEYLKIKNEPLRTCYVACKLPFNTGKNRYRDVVCYDDTRVRLKVIPGVEGSDYIHANYVSRYNKPDAFILTQGPTNKTVADFWRMVWEKQVFVIVKITKCVELGKRKCAQYWPDDGSMKYGNIAVQVVHTQNCEGYDLRTIKLQSKGGERTVMQFHFLAWPDYGVPDDGSAVLALLYAVREMQTNFKKYVKDLKQIPPYGPPIVVHCSAGVGRSGAFCTLDYCIDELSDQKRVNVQGAVRRLRLQRAYAIQTDEQYEFCYRAVLEHAKSTKPHTKKF